MCFFLLLSFFFHFRFVRETGVIASSNVNGNNGSLATIENRTSFTNNSHYNGTINELIVSQTIPHNSDGIDAKHMVEVEASLSSLPLTRINNNSGIISSVDGTLSKENGVQMPTAAHAETASAAAAASKTNATLPPPTSTTISTTSVFTTVAPSPTTAKIVTMHTTIAPLTGGHITNHMQTSQFIVSSNTRRDIPSAAATTSTLPITTNKPRE